MTGKDLTSLSEEIIKMINLVAFDVCNTQEIKVNDTVSPVVKRINAPVQGQIEKSMHTHLRKLIKKICIRNGVYAGAIKFTPNIDIVIYLKRRVTPAWLRDNPEGSQKEKS